MRHLQLIALVIILSVGCSKDFEPDYSNGYAIAEFNGEDWKGVPYGVFNAEKDKVHLSFYVNNEKGIRRESLSIANIPYRTKNNGDFDSSNNQLKCVYARLISDGDLISEAYNLILNESNFLNVTSIDSATGMIEGSFNLNFIIDELLGKNDESAPDLIKFNKGEFQVMLNG